MNKSQNGKGFKYLNISSSILGDKNLKASAKLLLAYLIFRQGKNPNSFWPQVVMVKELGISRATLQRDLKDLVRDGYISVKLIRKGESFRNEYKVNNVFPRPQIDTMENISTASNDNFHGLKSTFPRPQTEARKLKGKGKRKLKEEKAGQNPLSFSVKEVQNPKKAEEQRLHEWLIREQAAYIKEHGAEGIYTLDWKQYARTYYRPNWVEDEEKVNRKESGNR